MPQNNIRPNRLQVLSLLNGCSQAFTISHLTLSPTPLQLALQNFHLSFSETPFRPLRNSTSIFRKLLLFFFAPVPLYILFLNFTYYFKIYHLKKIPQTLLKPSTTLQVRTLSRKMLVNFQMGVAG